LEQEEQAIQTASDGAKKRIETISSELSETFKERMNDALNGLKSSTEAHAVELMRDFKEQLEEMSGQVNLMREKIEETVESNRKILIYILPAVLLLGLLIGAGITYMAMSPDPEKVVTGEDGTKWLRLTDRKEK
jgi:ferric-dicitrate binding protein FerR (iron transport regulator)